MLRALYNDSKHGTVALSPQTYEGRFALNNMATITFVIRTDSVDHPLVWKSLEIFREFMNISAPMSNNVDFIPSIIKKLLPWKLKHRGLKLHKDMLDCYSSLVRDVEREMKAGEEVEECLAKTLLEVQDEEKLTDLDIDLLVSTFLIGGVETTAAVMQLFTALIPAYPDIQRKAQAELDRLVGRVRLPTPEDEVNLPYIHAIIKEVERCRNPIWLGTPHMASQDFEYEGKLIPKDTVIVLNTWTLQHSPDRWEKPDEFEVSHLRFQRL